MTNQPLNMRPATFISGPRSNIGLVTEQLVVRIRRLIEERVASGQFESERQALKAAGISGSWLAERIHQVNAGKTPSVKENTLRKLAALLGLTLEGLVGDIIEDAPLVDVYPGRAWAIVAARALQLPEAAVQVVLRETPGHDPGRLYWFRRIESEAERLRPVTSR